MLLKPFNHFRIWSKIVLGLTLPDGRTDNRLVHLAPSMMDPFCSTRLPKVHPISMQHFNLSTYLQVEAKTV